MDRIDSVLNGKVSLGFHYHLGRTFRLARPER
jgi:hypothetical protein